MNIELQIYVHILVTNEGKKNKDSMPLAVSSLQFHFEWHLLYYITDVPALQHIAHFIIIFVFYYKYYSSSRYGRLYTIQNRFASYVLLEYMTNDSILEMHGTHMNVRNMYHYLKYTFFCVFSPVLIMLFHAFFINVFALKLYSEGTQQD